MSEVFLSGAVDIKLRTTKLKTELQNMHKLVTEQLKDISTQQLHIDFKITNLDELKQASPAIKQLASAVKSLKTSLSGIQTATLEDLQTSLAALSAIDLSNTAIGLADFKKAFRGLRTLGKMDFTAVSQSLAAINKSLQEFKINLNSKQVALLERFAAALDMVKRANLTAKQVKQYERMVDALRKQEQIEQQLERIERKRASLVRKIATGIKDMAVNFVSMIARQAAYAVVWTTIYGTIQSVNETLREGIGYFVELEKGASRALRTGLSLEQMSQAFAPTAAEGGADTGIPELVQEYRDLIQMQALAFTSQHTSQIKDYSDAVYELTSANISMGNSLQFADTSLKLAIAAEGDMAQTTRTLAGIYNIFGDTIRDVNSEQEKFEQIANTVLYVWGKEQIELEELNTALKFSANIARVAGIDYRVLVATLGHLNTNLVRSSTAGTGFRQVINSITKDMGGTENLVRTLAEDLDRAGFEMGDAFDPDAPFAFVEVIGKLRDAVVASSPELLQVGNDFEFSAKQMGAFLQQIGVRGGNVIASLILTFDEWKQKMQDVMSIQSGYIDSFVRMQELNLSDQFEILVKNLKLIPGSFLAGMESTKEMAKTLEYLNSKFEDILTSVFHLGKTFSTTWKRLAENIKGSKEEIKAFVVEVVFWLEEIGSFLITLHQLYKAFQPVISAIYSLTKGLTWFAEAALSVGALVVNVFSNLYQVIVSFVGTPLRILSQGFFQIVISIYKMTEALLLGKSVLEVFGNGIKGFIGSWKTEWGDLNVFLKEKVKGMVQAFKEFQISSKLGPSFEELMMEESDFSFDFILEGIDTLIKKETELSNVKWFQSFSERVKGLTWIGKDFVTTYVTGLKEIRTAIRENFTDVEEFQDRIDSLREELDFSGLAADRFKLFKRQGEELGKLGSIIDDIKLKILNLQKLDVAPGSIEATTIDLQIDMFEAQLEELYQMQIDALEKHEKEAADLTDKYRKEDLEKEKEYNELFMTEEEKKRQEVIDTYEEMLEKHGDSVEKRRELDQWLSDELQKLEEEEREENEETATKKLKNAEKVAEKIKELREDLLEDAREKAKLELDIEKQKQINLLKQEAMAAIAGTKSKKEKERILEQLDMALKMVELGYDIKEATLDQELAQQRMVELAAERLALEEEIAKLQKAKDIDPDVKEQQILEKQVRISEIGNQLIEEQMKIASAPGKVLDAQLDAMETILGEEDPRTKKIGEEFAKGLFTGQISTPTGEMSLGTMNMGGSFTPAATTGDLFGGTGSYATLDALFNKLETEDLKDKKYYAQHMERGVAPPAIVPSFAATYLGTGEANGNIGMREISPLSPEITINYNGQRSTEPVDAELTNTLINLSTILTRKTRQQGGRI